MFAAKHFDPVMGIDIHLVIPPTGTPVPIPHPHIGVVFDVMDYLPIFGGTIQVNGLPRATAGTAGKPIPHIPMGGPFSMPPGNEDEIFMGSTTVVADGAPFTFTALPVLSCQSVGMMAPVRAKKPKKSYGMVLPTTFALSIPVGRPVMVGGPPTVDIMGLAVSAGFATLGAAFKKMRAMQKGSKRVKKVSDAIHKKAANIMDKLGVPANMRNRVHKSVCAVTGHPVDIASGKMFTDWVDFELPGPIPLSWERTWYSTSVYQGPLGHGWHHNYDWKLMEEGRAVAVVMQDGRTVAFPALKKGEKSFNRQERLTLLKDEYGYCIKRTSGNLLRFAPDEHNKHEHTAVQRLVSITDPTGEAKVSFYYNQVGHLVEIIDSSGRHIHLENDIEGRIRKIYFPHPDRDKPDEYYCAVEYTYHNGDMVAMRDVMGSTVAYKYYNHLMYQETNYNGLNFYFKYDGGDHNARCVHTWGDGGIYNHQLFYDVEQNITVVQNSLGHKTTYYHNQALPYKVVDSLGAEVLTVCNEFNEVVCEVDELGHKTRFEYDDRGNTTKIINPDGASLSIEYDENDNPIRATDAIGGEWFWQYDKYGQLLSKMDPLDRKTHFVYDGFKLKTIIDPAGQKTSLVYDSNNSPRAVTTPDGCSHRWEFDTHGRVTTETDAKGSQRLLRYDLLVRVVQVNEPDGNIRVFTYDPEGNVIRATDKQYDVTFQYQGMGRMISRTQAGITVKFEYDTEEQLTGIINEHGYAYRFLRDPTGEIQAESGFDGLIRRYLRDKGGHLRRIQRPDNRFSDYTYDAVGRVIQVLHSDGSQERYEYRLDGELMRAVNHAAEITFERNILGQITKEIRGDYWVSSEYNVMGLRTRMQSSLGADQQIQRNTMGDVVGVKTGDGQFETLIERDELGLELERSLPGGIKSRWVRDRLGRPCRHEIYKGKSQQTSKTYVWGVNNRLEKVIDSLQHETVYSHDKLGGLVSARYGDGIVDLRIPDAVGNLFQTYNRNDREYGPAGQLLWVRKNNGIVRYEYDAEGNLTGKTEPGQKIWRYEWNGAGMLGRVIRPDGREVLFEYDALGRRLKKTFNGRTTHWVWDGNNPLHEWVELDGRSVEEKRLSTTHFQSEDIAVQRHITRQPIQPQAPPAERGTQERPITWLFEPESFAPMAKQIGDDYCSIVTDYLGTPTAAYNQAGEQVWSADISAWGELRNVNGDKQTCPFRWPGQYEDEETGLYYNRFRYYDPGSGQYVSQDPIGTLGGLNLYQYVPDVTTWGDPFGLQGGSLSCGGPARKRTDAELQDAADRIHRVLRSKSGEPNIASKNRTTTVTQSVDSSGNVLHTVTSSSGRLTPAQRSAARQEFGKDVRLSQHAMRVRTRGKGRRTEDRGNHSEAVGERATQGNTQRVQASSSDAKHGGKACEFCAPMQQAAGIQNVTGVQ